MEDPVFYHSRPNGQTVSARQRQALLKKISQLEREASLVQKHAVQLTSYARRLGIGAPELVFSPLAQWESLLRGLKNSRL
jgi:hypothetical protein